MRLQANWLTEHFFLFGPLSIGDQMNVFLCILFGIHTYLTIAVLAYSPGFKSGKLYLPSWFLLYLQLGFWEET